MANSSSLLVGTFWWRCPREVDNVGDVEDPVPKFGWSVPDDA